jgi:predicted nucleic acid-binding protein
MSLFVIDASVVIKWFVSEPHTDAALRLLDVERRFLAPDHVFAETTNVVWKHVRRHHFSTEFGYEVIAGIGRAAANIDLISCRDLAVDAYKIAVRYDRSVYDAMYVALAKKRNTHLITADDRLYNALSSAPEIAPHIQSLRDY